MTTSDDIIPMAREAGFMRSQLTVYNRERIERFYALAVAAEREACAELCELWNTTPGGTLATAIRARSNA